MNDTEVTVYRMNPAEDTILFGDELRDGMWVLADTPAMRRPYGYDDDSRLRSQRFRCVTRLRREPGSDGGPERTVFVAEWVDGYQEVHSYAVTYGWLVKKKDLEAFGAEAAEPSPLAWVPRA